MIANELADELDKMIPALPLTVLIKSATMLRQQQAEIEALINKYEFLSGHAQQSDIMINELRQELALQKLSDINQEIEDRDSAIYATGYWKGIEYKRIRELTDEEIDKIIKQHDWYSKTWVDMVRSIESAILKKASERA